MGRLISARLNHAMVEIFGAQAFSLTKRRDENTRGSCGGNVPNPVGKGCGAILHCAGGRHGNRGLLCSALLYFRRKEVFSSPKGEDFNGRRGSYCISAWS